MPNPISHTSKSGTTKVWNDSSVMRYPESERPGGGSYEQTADEYIAEQYNAQKAVLDSWLSNRYSMDFDRYRSEIPDGSTSGGYMQGADGWFRIWRNNHWHKVYAGEDDGIDAAYRPVWEASGFCLRWDEINENMLDYDPDVPEFVRFKGVDVSLLPGRKFEIGGSRTAYRKFIRWCETAPKPVEVRKDKISSPNDFPVDWIETEKIGHIIREELDPLHMMQDGRRDNYEFDRARWIDTSVMIPPSPEIYMIVKPIPNSDTNRFDIPDDSNKSDRWKTGTLFSIRKNVSKNVNYKNSEIIDYAINSYLIIPPDADPAELEVNNWQDCSVGFILCGEEKIVKIYKRINFYMPSNPGIRETAIIIAMARGTGSNSGKIFANAFSMDYNYVPGNTAWVDYARSTVKSYLTTWPGVVSWNYDETKFTPVLNYAEWAGKPGFSPCVKLFPAYDYYPIRLYDFFVGGIMKNGQALKYHLKPWYSGGYRLKDIERGETGQYVADCESTPTVMSGSAVPDVSIYARHRVDLTDPSSHHYLSKNDLNVIEGTAVTQRTVWNVIRDSLRPKLYRQGQGGSGLTGQYIDNLWSKYASTYISEASRDWKLVDNTDNPLYTVNGQPGCTKVLHIEETTGNTELNMKVIPIEPNTAYTFSVYCRGNKSFRLYLRTYATRDLASAQGTALFDSYQVVTPTTSWTQVSITSTATAATYASLWMYIPDTGYASGDYLEICGPSLTPGTTAQWAPAKGDTWPLPASGASAYSPDSSSWGDYYQMVRMPNVWCAPYDKDGRHEFWISLSKECPPGMIPWFVNQDENGDWIPAGKYKLFGRYSVRAPKSRSISPDGGDIKYPSTRSWKTSGVEIARGAGPIGPMCEWAVPNRVISGDVSWDNTRNPVYMTEIEDSYSLDVAGCYNTWLNWENSYTMHANPEFSSVTFAYTHLQNMANNAGLYMMSYWEYHVFNMIKAAYYGGDPRFDKFLPDTVGAYGDIGGTWRACAALHMRELGQVDCIGCLNVDGSLGDTYTEGTGIGYIRDFGFQEDNHSSISNYIDSFVMHKRSLSSCADPSVGGVNMFMWVEELGSELQVSLAGLGSNLVASQDFDTYSMVPAVMVIPANIAASKPICDQDASFGRQFTFISGKSRYTGNNIMLNRSIADMDAWGWPRLLVDSWADQNGLTGAVNLWTRDKINHYDWQASFGITSGRSSSSYFSDDKEFLVFYHWAMITFGSGFHKETPITSPWSSRLWEHKSMWVNGGANSAFCTLDCITEEDLPYDYEVEYLESDGNQWIDTEVLNKGKLAFDCVFKNDSSVSPGYGNVLGARKSSQTQELQMGNYQNGTVSVGASGGRSTGLGFYPNRLNRITYDGDRTVTVNGTVKTVTQYTDITQPLSVYLFCFNQNGTAAQKQRGRIYYVRFGEDGRKGDFIPVSRDGVGYMYNKVTGKLHGNKGTGSFKMGPRVIK